MAPSSNCMPSFLQMEKIIDITISAAITNVIDIGDG